MTNISKQPKAFYHALGKKWRRKTLEALNKLHLYKQLLSIYNDSNNSVRPNKDTMIWLAMKVSNTTDAAIIHSTLFVKLNTEKFAICKKGAADISYDTSGFTIRQQNFVADRMRWHINVRGSREACLVILDLVQVSDVDKCLNTWIQYSYFFKWIQRSSVSLLRIAKLINS
eukprot:CAMPEP_0169124288 /NCGR_PEP_ID=MMETSP1015-20121227/34241_1 /TAXON_ID=342587 /ORGANISM="Karlodinium micrum, Strain CCMP2283" /LENGTH=170 /DNA_ID=CAMNT_0009187687 /DNA_START=81 /DNA_END=593 /DNA_ORIENTATION=+